MTFKHDNIIVAAGKKKKKESSRKQKYIIEFILSVSIRGANLDSNFWLGLKKSLILWQ